MQSLSKCPNAWTRHTFFEALSVYVFESTALLYRGKSKISIWHIMCLLKLHLSSSAKRNEHFLKIFMPWQKNRKQGIILTLWNICLALFWNIKKYRMRICFYFLRQKFHCIRTFSYEIINTVESISHNNFPLEVRKYKKKSTKLPHFSLSYTVRGKARQFKYYPIFGFRRIVLI